MADCRRLTNWEKESSDHITEETKNQITMIQEFQPSVIEAFKYYVYCLVSTRDNRIFSIGKGKGNRVFQHAKDSLNENDQSLNLISLEALFEKANKLVSISYGTI